jgi:hypothetical protein
MGGSKSIPTMPVVPLTIAISLCLVFTFLVFFLREHVRGGIGGAEHDSLLPLGEETPRLMPVRVKATAPAHAHPDEDCGCHDGSRPLCDGCLHRHDHA